MIGKGETTQNFVKQTIILFKKIYIDSETDIFCLKMELPTPQPETLIALNNFLLKWKQDPASQYNLNIALHNVLLWDPLDATRNFDLMLLLDQSIEVNLDDFLLPEEIEETTDPIPTLESEIEDTTDLISALEPEIENLEDSITILLTDVSQTIQPMTKSLTNPFIGRTWETQVDKMLTQLTTHGRTRKDLNRKIQTYYYLGKLLDQHADPAIIKDFIEKKQGKRKAKDTWRGAYRTYELFRICPKEVISHLQTLTATQLIKLTDGVYHRLLDSCKLKFVEQIL